MIPNNVIEGGEFENRDPRARMHIVYATVNNVLEIQKSLGSIQICQFWYQTLRLDEINNFCSENFSI